MTLLRDTLTGIVSAFNRAHLLRELSLSVTSANGQAAFSLADYLPAGASNIVVTSLSVSSDAVEPRWHVANGMLHIVLVSKGKHYQPQPWDALKEPVAVQAVVGFKPAALEVPDLKLSGLFPFSVSLPPGLEHIVEHNKGRTRFIERLTDADGRAQFASVEALDANRVRVTLVEPVAVRLDMIFMPDNAGQGVS